MSRRVALYESSVLLIVLVVVSVGTRVDPPVRGRSGVGEEQCVLGARYESGPRGDQEGRSRECQRVVERLLRTSPVQSRQPCSSSNRWCRCVSLSCFKYTASTPSCQGRTSRVGLSLPRARVSCLMLAYPTRCCLAHDAVWTAPHDDVRRYTPLLARVGVVTLRGG